MLIALTSIIYNTINWFGQRQVPVFENTRINVFPINGIFSYDSSKLVPDTYTPNQCVEIFVDCINPSSLPLTIYGFQLKSIFHGYECPFDPLTIETSPFLNNQKVYGVISESELKKGIVHHIHLFDDKIIVIPPYSAYRYNEQFHATKGIISLGSSEMLLSFVTIQNKLLGGKKVVQKIQISSSRFTNMVNKKVFPIHELSQDHLDQLDISNHI